MAGANGQNKNTFKQGLNSDMHPLDTPNTVMVDNSNAKLVTSEGDEFILQNMKGNHLKTALTSGFRPVAVKVFNNISYIISQNISNPAIGEIGTFPSPDWDLLNQQIPVIKTKMAIQATDVVPVQEPSSLPTTISQSFIQSRTFSGLFPSEAEVGGFLICQWRITYNGTSTITYGQPFEQFSETFSDISITVDKTSYQTILIGGTDCNDNVKQWVDYAPGAHLSIDTINTVRYEIGDLDLFQSRDCVVDFSGTGVIGTIVASGTAPYQVTGNILNWEDINGFEITNVGPGGFDGTVPVVPYYIGVAPYFEVLLSTSGTPSLPTITGGTAGPVHTEFYFTYNMGDLGLTPTEAASATFSLRHVDNYSIPITSINPFMEYRIDSVTPMSPDTYTNITLIPGQEVPITIIGAGDTTIFELVLKYQGVEILGQANNFELYITYETPQGEILVDMLDVYAPLHNFFDYATIPDPTEAQLDDESNYTAPFRTDSLNFKGIDFVDIELQPSYDRSVNIIFTDDINKIRLVNSRFIVKEGNKQATIADRQGSRDTNIYSDDRWGNVDLILTSETIAQLDFQGVIDGGNLLPGGYRFYFVYANSDLQTTNVFSESRLVQVYKSNGNSVSGGDPVERVGKSVKFQLSNLDTKFLYVKVFFARDMGEFNAGSYELNEVFNLFTIPTGGTVDLLITGYELTRSHPQGFLDTQFSDLSAVQTLAAVQGSLAIGNVSIDIEDLDYLREICAQIQITESSDWMGSMDPDNADRTYRQKRMPYMHADNTYHRLGYWSGETYEVGIVFKMANTNLLSPVIPVRGIDNFDGLATYSGLGNIYDPPGFVDPGLDPNNWRENTNGLYRTAEGKTVMDGDGPFPDSPNITFLQIDTTILTADAGLKELTDGFFIVRKQRIKDCQYEGILSHAQSVPLSDPIVGTDCLTVTGTQGVGTGLGFFGIGSMTNNAGDFWIAAPGGSDVGSEKRFDWPAKYIPMPATMWNDADPVGGSTTAKPKYNEYTQFLNRGSDLDPISPRNVISHLSFYTPDIVTRATDVASFFSGTTRGLRYNNKQVYMSIVDDGDQPDNPSILGSKYIDIGGRNGNLDTNSMAMYVPDIVWNYITAGQDTITPETFGAIVRNIQTRVISNGPAEFHNSYGYVPLTAAEDVASDDRGRVFHRFDDFIGMEILFGDSTTLKDLLEHGSGLAGTLSSAPFSTQDTFMSKTDWYADVDNNNIVLGILARIYQSSQGPIPMGASWQAKFQSTTNSGYFSISDRYDWDRAIAAPVIDLFDGDCYIGEMYKRINYKLGIESDPAATNADLYGDEAAALENAGMTLAFVASSSTNFSLRSEEFKSASEKLIFGTDRRFYPLYPLSSIRTLKQLDSKLYYDGYNLELADLQYSRQTIELPAVIDSFPYRIMISAPADLTSFTNGYRDFSGLNFRDYDSAFGQIIKLVALHGQLYVIWEYGIGAIQTSEKTMVSDNDGGVYVDQASRLHPQAQIITNKYGSTDPYSIIVSADSVYGIDWTNNKIWQIRGGQFSLISDFKVERILTEYKAFFDNNSVVHKFYGGYDSYKRNIFFNYGGVNLGSTVPVGSIYYNETLNIWISKLTFYPYFIFNLRENWFSFDFSNNTVSTAGQIWEHDSDEAPFCNFYGVQHPFEYEFVLVDNPSLQKILNNLKIISTEEYPIFATYTIVDKHDYETNRIKETSFVDRLIKRYKTITATMLAVEAGSLYLVFSEDPGLLAGEHIVVDEGTKYEVQDIILYLDHYFVYVTYWDPVTSTYINLVSQAYTGEESVVINNGIIKENILYKEDHFYIVVGNKFILITEAGLIGTGPSDLESDVSGSGVNAISAFSDPSSHTSESFVFSFIGLDPRSLLTGAELAAQRVHFAGGLPGILGGPTILLDGPETSGLTAGTPSSIIAEMDLAKPRDKYIKIKLRYTGNKQVFIQAVESMFTYSYS